MGSIQASNINDRTVLEWNWHNLMKHRFKWENSPDSSDCQFVPFKRRLDVVLKLNGYQS